MTPMAKMAMGRVRMMGSVVVLKECRRERERFGRVSVFFGWIPRVEFEFNENGRALKLRGQACSKPVKVLIQPSKARDASIV